MWDIIRKTSTRKKSAALKEDPYIYIGLARFTWNKKTSTGKKMPHDATDKSRGIKRYFFLFKKYGTTKIKYALHSSDNLFGPNQNPTTPRMI